MNVIWCFVLEIEKSVSTQRAVWVEWNGILVIDSPWHKTLSCCWCKCLTVEREHLHYNKRCILYYLNICQMRIIVMLDFKNYNHCFNFVRETTVYFCSLYIDWYFVASRYSEVDQFLCKRIASQYTQNWSKGIAEAHKVKSSKCVVAQLWYWP